VNQHTAVKKVGVIRKVLEMAVCDVGRVVSERLGEVVVLVSCEVVVVVCWRGIR